MQPADVAAFKPIKNAWRKGVLNFYSENPNGRITKESFAPILKKVLDTCLKEISIANGFKACGLYPWNKSAIDYTKCLGKVVQVNPDSLLEAPRSQISSQKVMSFVDFQNIIGSEIFLSCKNLRENTDEILFASTEIRLAFNMYNFYVSTDNDQ